MELGGWHGYGLPEPDLLLPGKSAESDLRHRARGHGAGGLLHADAREAGSGKPVLRHFPAEHLRKRGLFHQHFRRHVWPVRLGAGVLVECDVAGHLRPAAPDGAGHGVYV